MIQLAPWYYRSVMAPVGPIASLKLFAFSPTQIQASAKLRDELRHLNSNLKLYADVDGCGTANLKLEAKYKAISEAIERWAFYEAYRNDELWESGGFNIVPTTSGMAAYPSFSCRPARCNALLEGQERWSLVNWWHLRLKHRLIEKTGNRTTFQILSPFDNSYTVLIHEEFEVKGNTRHAYGFACRSSIVKAREHAVTELTRNLRVLRSYLSLDHNIKPSNLTEIRMLAASTNIGYQEFRNRISNTEIIDPIEPPKLIFDTELKGAWSKYARVWRCLYEGHREMKDGSVFLF